MLSHFSRVQLCATPLFYSCSFQPSVLTSYLLSIMKPFLSFQLNFCSLFPPTLPAGFHSLHESTVSISHCQTFSRSFLPFYLIVKFLRDRIIFIFIHIIFILVCIAPATVIWTLKMTREMEPAWIIRIKLKSNVPEVRDRWAPGLDSWNLSDGVKFKLCYHPDTPRAKLVAEAELR